MNAPNVGALVRIGRRRAVYLVQAVELRRGGALVVAYGPIGSAHAKGGLAFWVGERPLRFVSPLGRRRQLAPVAFRLVIGSRVDFERSVGSIKAAHSFHTARRTRRKSLGMDAEGRRCSTRQKGAEAVSGDSASAAGLRHG